MAIPMSHDPKAYHKLLKTGGKYVFLGVCEQMFGTFMARMSGCGSGDFRVANTGTMAHTQEVIDFCDKHKLFPNTKLISVSEINAKFEELDAGNDNALRFVIDLSTLN